MAYINPMNRLCMIYYVQDGDDRKAFPTKREAVLEAQRTGGQLYRLHLLKRGGTREVCAQLLNGSIHWHERELLQDYADRGPSS